MAQSRSFFDDIQRELECSVCQEQFSKINEPKILKCLHTFCKTCLNAWLRQQREGELSCPTCRQITECPNNSIDRLPSNLFYKQMLEIVEAYSGQGQQDSAHCGNCEETKTLKFYCSDCNCFLCEDCVGGHKKLKVLRGHHVKEIGNFESSDVQEYARKANGCKKHKDELRFYCGKCKICICRDCAMLEHRDHHLISFDQALKNKASEFETKIQEVETKGFRLKNLKESLEKTGVRVNNSFDQATTEVHRVAKHCIALIRQHEETMTQGLLNQKVCFQNAFSTQMTRLDEKLVEIDSSVEFGKEVFERNNLPEILNVEEILERRFQELSSSLDEFRIKLSSPEVRYVSSHTSSITEALGKLITTNTDPSCSVAGGEGLTEGIKGEECAFTIITKDWQGQTTYNEMDKVMVDIQSLRTGKITSPSITDAQDGCYKVTHKPEAAGEFSVSITAAGKAILGSPFQLIVKDRKRRSEKKDPRQRESSWYL